MNCVEEAAAKVHERTKPVEVDNHLGGCPRCGRNDGYRNVGPNHWFFCHDHKMAWCAGTNLFASWRDETEVDWQQTRDLFADFTAVAPVFMNADIEPCKNAKLPLLNGSTNQSDVAVDLGAIEILYHPALEDGFQGWADDCGRNCLELREECEAAIRGRHCNAFIEGGHEAIDRRSAIFTLQFAELTVYYSFERTHILIRGFGYPSKGEPDDYFDSGGLYH